MKFFFATLLASSFALAQTMTIEEYEPKSTLVVPQHPVTQRFAGHLAAADGKLLVLAVVEFHQLVGDLVMVLQIVDERQRRDARVVQEPERQSQ